jgi:hypothetical protein
MPKQIHRRLLSHGQDVATPALLPILFAATLAMVGAVATIGLTDSDWADVGAIVLLLGTLGLVIGTTLRQVRDDEPPTDADPLQLSIDGEDSCRDDDTGATAGPRHRPIG